MNLSWQPGMTLELMEKMAIQACLRFHNNNKSATARSLGICIRTLDTKLAEYAKQKEKEDGLRKQHEEQQRSNLDRQRFGNAGKPNFIPGTITCVGSDGPQQPVGRPASQPENGHDVASGQRMEPAVTVPTQQPMPLPKREEVQEVSPRQTPPRGNQRNR